jgi:excisionase family DNA binding protein
MDDEIALNPGDETDPVRTSGTRYDKRGINYGLLSQDIYSVKDLALVIGVHPTTILEQIKTGKLKALFLGGPAGYRLYRKNIIEWVEGGHGGE